MVGEELASEISLMLRPNCHGAGPTDNGEKRVFSWGNGYFKDPKIELSIQVQTQRDLVTHQIQTPSCIVKDIEVQIFFKPFMKTPE